MLSSEQATTGNSVVINGTTYNPGDQFSFTSDAGVSVNGTVNDDGTVTGDDGNTYDSNGNLITQ